MLVSMDIERLSVNTYLVRPGQSNFPKLAIRYQNVGKYGPQLERKTIPIDQGRLDLSMAQANCDNEVSDTALLKDKGIVQSFYPKVRIVLAERIRWRLWPVVVITQPIAMLQGKGTLGDAASVRGRNIGNSDNFHSHSHSIKAFKLNSSVPCCNERPHQVRIAFTEERNIRKILNNLNRLSIHEFPHMLVPAVGCILRTDLGVDSA